MNTFYTYMLRCRGASGSCTIYTGYSNALERRVSEHASGKGARFTKNKDLELVFFQTFNTQREAMARERELKALSRKKKDSLIKDILVNELYRATLAGHHVM